MHLLGFAFAPRVRALHDKRLFIHGKAELYLGLQSIISTTSLNLKDIETHWIEVLRLASSIKQGTVTASLMMKKLSSYGQRGEIRKRYREPEVVTIDKGGANTAAQSKLNAGKSADESISVRPSKYLNNLIE